MTMQRRDPIRTLLPIAYGHWHLGAACAHFNNYTPDTEAGLMKTGVVEHAPRIGYTHFTPDDEFETFLSTREEWHRHMLSIGNSATQQDLAEYWWIDKCNIAPLILEIESMHQEMERFADTSETLESDMHEFINLTAHNFVLWEAFAYKRLEATAGLVHIAGELASLPCVHTRTPVILRDPKSIFLSLRSTCKGFRRMLRLHRLETSGRMRKGHSPKTLAVQKTPPILSSYLCRPPGKAGLCILVEDNDGDGDAVEYKKVTKSLGSKRMSWAADAIENETLRVGYWCR